MFSKIISYQMVGEKPNLDFVIEQIQRYAFTGELGRHEDEHMGFAPIPHLAEQPMFLSIQNRYLLFCFRYDWWTLDAKLVKQEMQKRRVAYLKEHQASMPAKLKRKLKADVSKDLRDKATLNTQICTALLDVNHQSILWDIPKTLIIETANGFLEGDTKSYRYRPGLYADSGPLYIGQLLTTMARKWSPAPLEIGFNCNLKHPEHGTAQFRNALLDEIDEMHRLVTDRHYDVTSLNLHIQQDKRLPSVINELQFDLNDKGVISRINMGADVQFADEDQHETSLATYMLMLAQCYQVIRSCLHECASNLQMDPVTLDNTQSAHATSMFDNEVESTNHNSDGHTDAEQPNHDDAASKDMNDEPAPESTESQLDTDLTDTETTTDSDDHPSDNEKTEPLAFDPNAALDGIETTVVPTKRPEEFNLTPELE